MFLTQPEGILSNEMFIFSKRFGQTFSTNMSKRFYLFGGIDDPKLKQAYLNSIPAPLNKEAFQ